MFKKIFDFFGSVKEEGQKVVWARRQQVIAGGIMVFIASAIMAMFFLFVDQGFVWLFDLVFKA
ncbi:MAG: preprotein translocase subunit SecE [Alphaproteobacteria bacterium]|nr:preprotein translocase subunit SecE [Alphaproteobacteria bacterium]